VDQAEPGNQRNLLMLGAVLARFQGRWFTFQEAGLRDYYRFADHTESSDCTGRESPV